jgi:hypothetical protein
MFLKMPKTISRIILAASLVCGSTHFAMAQVAHNEALENASELIAAGNSQMAYAVLVQMADVNAGDPSFDYQLGLAAADTGRHTEAILAFQRVLAAQPNNSQARAELARAYALAGDIDTARAQFDTVVSDPSLPDPVRQRFDRLVRDYSQQIDGESSVSGFVDVKGGWDSNINAATDETQLVIPLFAAFGAGTLGANARETESGFVDAVAGVSGVKAISRQSRVFGSVLGNYRDNFENQSFDQGSLTGTAGVGHTLAKRDVISASGQAQQFWLGGNSFRTSLGAIGQYTKALSEGRALSVSAEYFDLDFENDPLRDAERYSVGASFATRRVVVSAAAGHEETKSALTDHLSFDYFRVSVSGEKRLGDRVSLVGGVTGQIRPYDAPDPLFLEERQDEQLDLSFGVKVRVLDDKTFLRPQVTYTRNWSNFAINDYDRAVVSVGLRREF